MSRYFQIIVALATLSIVKCQYFDVELREQRVINGNGQIEFNLKVRKVNKTIYAVSGDVKPHIFLNNSYQVRTLLFKKQGNEYRLTPFHIGMNHKYSGRFSVHSIKLSDHKGPHNFCDYIQNQAFMYDEIMMCSDAPPKKDCPWPVKNVVINKCIIPVNKTPKYLSGEYRVDCEVIKGEESIGGFQVLFNVISII